MRPRGREGAGDAVRRSGRGSAVPSTVNVYVFGQSLTAGAVKVTDSPTTGEAWLCWIVTVCADAADANTPVEQKNNEHADQASPRHASVQAGPHALAPLSGATLRGALVATVLHPASRAPRSSGSNNSQSRFCSTSVTIPTHSMPRTARTLKAVSSGRYRRLEDPAGRVGSPVARDPLMPPPTCAIVLRSGIRNRGDMELVASETIPELPQAREILVMAPVHDDPSLCLNGSCRSRLSWTSLILTQAPSSSRLWVNFAHSS